jgi:hypothetical protein
MIPFDNKSLITKLILLKDEKNIALICSENRTFSIYHFPKNKIIFQDTQIQPSSMIEIPNKKIIIGDNQGNLHLYTYENIQKVQKLYQMSTNYLDKIPIDFL